MSRILLVAQKPVVSRRQVMTHWPTSLIGEEAVFGVLSRADEWIQVDWPRYRYLSLATNTTSSTGAQSTLEAPTQRSHDNTAVLTRILIYSHHIISKKKRSDMKQLANKYNLTGYIKIGWPGLMILEGLNHAPHEFYDEIRRWNWKYLVVRGEMQESVTVTDSSSSDEGGGNVRLLDLLNSLRRFEKFVEVDDMSVVATACREADLEDLFKTSMKVYKNSSETTPDSSPSEDSKPYGVLVHVDHMNDAKGYTKWLRKNCSELDVCVAIKQLQEESKNATTRISDNSSVGRRTNIIVCLVGEKADVSSLLKRWRTSRVDVDARGGKPCLERMTTVLMEGFLERAPSSRIDWEQHQQPFQVNNHDAETSSNQREYSNPIELIRAI